MSTEQYAMVRGRVIRVTKLSAVGGVLDEPGQYVVSNCITKVGINEIVETRCFTSSRRPRSSDTPPTSTS
jgi:hypothetical protein